MKAELEWVRANPKGRHAKSKARVARFEELESQEFQKRNETQELYIPPGPRLGELVSKRHWSTQRFRRPAVDRRSRFQAAQGRHRRRDRPQRRGQNDPVSDAGRPGTAGWRHIAIGDTVKLAYVDQSRDSLSACKTVWQEISDGLDVIAIGSYQINSRAYVGRFNFKGQDQQKFVKDLSGGERNRVHLAKLLKSGGNVLLLDEPTNDLDVETLRALEEALLAFAGCAVIISHDRWFLDRIATHILAFEGDSQVIWFEGNYADYEADRKRRLGVAADQPHRPISRTGSIMYLRPLAITAALAGVVSAGCLRGRRPADRQRPRCHHLAATGPDFRAVVA
jgi:sulfate-transporting ATPase